MLSATATNAAARCRSHGGRDDRHPGRHSGRGMVYRVEVAVANLGTAETTAANLINIEIVNGSTTVQQLPTCSSVVRFQIERVTMSGASSLKIAAKNAAIAGSIYCASISATLLT